MSPASAAKHTTGNNKQQKHGLRSQGVDVSVIEGEGDLLFWLRPGGLGYVRFLKRDLEELRGGKVKL